MIRYVIGAAVVIMLLFVSGALATYVFSGVFMFLGLVILCESVKPIKYIFKRTSNFIDLLIFGFSVYAISEMGATVAIGLSVCGLLFSLFYKPLLKVKK